MSLFNQQMDRVHAQLTGLTTGRKLFWGCLLAAVIAGGIWWGRTERQVAWEPVLDQPVDATQLAQITTYLSGKAVPFKDEAGKVLVPADRKIQVLAELLYEDLLPGNTDSTFDAIAKTSIFDSSSKVNQLYLNAKQERLRNIIGRFPGVRIATVLIDPTSEQHINGSITPSALVDIQTRGGVKNSRQLATAAVNAVTGAQSNLPRDKVQVAIDGAFVRTTIDPNELASDEKLERIQQREQIYVAKVRKQLSFIPDALISVTVNIADRPKPSRPTTRRSDGLIANTGTTISSPRKDIETVTSASVAIPRSYFVKIYTRSNPKIADPSDGLLQPIIDVELDKIRRLVRTTLGIHSDDEVTVASYVDQQPALITVGTQTASAPVTLLLSNRTTQAAIAITGIMLLVVAPLLLRRQKPVGASVSSRPIHAALLSPRSEDFADEEYAEDGDEPDDHYAELGTVAHDSPDATANVLEKWMRQQ
jgi:flagellar biosynthesis/type III secretory pathway M-ring protein FliF/YscJ